MTTNKLILIGISSIVTTTLSAQNLQEAITKTDNERFEVAANDFKNLIAKESNKGENYFYYGENFFKNNELDSANLFYEKGVDVNATSPLNYVGLGKVLWYKGNTSGAKTLFFKAATLGANKNAEVMRKTAEAYIYAENKSLDEAISLLNAAIKIDPKNADSYLLLGDATLEKNPADGGPAIKHYNKATELNPKSPQGDLRAGKLYQRGRNYQLALDLYKKAETTDPTYAPAYREKAELYYKAGQKANAIESYKKYLALNNSMKARERYAQFLYSNKQYPDAIAEIEELQKLGNNNLYLNRVLGHSYAEVGNKSDTAAYTKGLKALNNFFDQANATPNFKFDALDYKYKGILLSKTGKDSLGIIEMEKAATMDPSKAGEITNAIAQSYMKSKKYSKVIETYEKKINGDANNLSGQDWYELGRAYYYEGGNKTREKKDADAVQLFIKSDTCFSKLAQKNPTYAVAYFWRAKANVQQDLKNEKWLAKPHYEKGLFLLKLEERTTGANKLNVIEACEYLGYNAVTLKENTKAKEYFTIIKELDANNKKQIDFFKSPQGK